MSCSTALVCSSAVPLGMSTTIWNSDLLSKGSIFSTTSFTAASDTASISAASIASHSLRRAPLPCSRFKKGPRRSRKKRLILVFCSSGTASWCAPAKRYTSQGVMMKATASEISIPMLALIGIGLMYGPIRPLTKAIGSSAAITVKVASIVGLPTSSTASGMISDSGWCCASARRRWMFSTTTMASSTRIPMEKISANSDTRFSVKP
ncbi:MAG: hypothetical protein A2063_03090 [Gallionellales bacterium GWA2_60_142]|nr:MAG: hypothetical protein A2063_03090 [Gallionellales bacterium GWA2_60_142]